MKLRRQQATVEELDDFFGELDASDPAPFDPFEGEDEVVLSGKDTQTNSSPKARTKPIARPRAGSKVTAPTAPSVPVDHKSGAMSQPCTYVVTVRAVDTPLAYRCRIWATDKRDANEKVKTLMRWMQSGLRTDIGLRLWLPKPPDSLVHEHWMEIDPELVMRATVEGPFAPGESPKPIVPQSPEDDKWWCFACDARVELCDCPDGPTLDDIPNPRDYPTGRKRAKRIKA